MPCEVKGKKKTLKDSLGGSEFDSPDSQSLSLKFEQMSLCCWKFGKHKPQTEKVQATTNSIAMGLVMFHKVQVCNSCTQHPNVACRWSGPTCVCFSPHTSPIHPYVFFCPTFRTHSSAPLFVNFYRFSLPSPGQFSQLSVNFSQL